VVQAQNALDGKPVERRVEVERVVAATQPETSEETETGDGEPEVNATEAAERKAEELGVDITTVEGSGQGGRVVVGDVDDAAEDDK
jgi:pyruvate dehydrogenase E2 component (dihydrolipoamide acetyltransferase)